MTHSSSPVVSDLSIRRLTSLESINPEEWNGLVNTDNPFLTYEFLHGLEEHDCLQGQGWTPCHFAVYSNNILVGALPLYIKTNSYGEFVFDWLWADAYQRAGGYYYPKLVSAIPFTPVRGPRLLINDTFPDSSAVKNLLLDEIIETTKTTGMSSFHCLFPEQTDQAFYLQHNLLSRKGVQFHWHNRGYSDFDDFLGSLTSKKRKKIKRERRQVNEQGIEIEILTGSQINTVQWKIFYEFYCSTFYRRWGSPRMTYDFFLSLSEKLPDQTLLILARHKREYVAGAFAMLGGGTLYGRHWGCSNQYPYLHFELCYYQTIEYCIRHGLDTVDAGVQGEHKLSRGFQPVATCSYHWIQHPDFMQAVKNFLDREKVEIDAYIEALNRHLPFKRRRQGNVKSKDNSDYLITHDHNDSG